MPLSEQFILWGLSRLTVRVAESLRERGARVIVVRMEKDGDLLVPHLSEHVNVLTAESEDPVDVMRQICADPPGCLLALSESDLDNIRAAVAVQEIAPEVPVVLRTFDPALADELEQGMNVRRAYSVSALG